MLFNFAIYFTNFIINVIPSHTIRLFYYRRIFKFKIGTGSSIHLRCRFNSVKNIEIGENSTINQDCRIDNRYNVSIGDNVILGFETMIITAQHDMQAYDFSVNKSGPVGIGDYAFLGSRCLILPRVSIGKGAVVASGAVVTKDVQDYEIVAGVPAKNIGWRRKDLGYNASYIREFH
jgi:acetyltransferase-like isoleucine patch superfamily enzyme